MEVEISDTTFNRSLDCGAARDTKRVAAHCADLVRENDLCAGQVCQSKVGSRKSARRTTIGAYMARHRKGRGTLRPVCFRDARQSVGDDGFTRAVMETE